MNDKPATLRPQLTRLDGERPVGMAFGRARRWSSFRHRQTHVTRDNLRMGFHHVALATRDTAATHQFYTEVMGFTLVKVIAAPTPGEGGGFSKHFFYETTGSATPSGDPGMIAFWEIHDDLIGNDFPTDINKAAGLPWWVNHFAFDAPTMEDLQRHRDRWRSFGHHVLEVDHEFCISIYTRDPNGNMVEFCHSVREFRPDEIAEAHRLLNDPTPELHKEFSATVHKPLTG